MTRIWNVVRLHLVNRWTYVVLPWIILGTAFAMTLAIWMILRSVGVTGIGVASGAVGSIFIYLMVAAIMSINLTFPFALGFSVTRRDFYLGTALTFALIGAANAVVLTALAAIEVASGGWWLNGTIFTVLGPDASPLAYWFLFFMRWRVNGMVLFWVLGGVALVGGFALITYTNSWTAIGAWMTESGAIGLAAWSLVPTILAGIAGFAVLSKATTKN